MKPTMIQMGEVKYAPHEGKEGEFWVTGPHGTFWCRDNNLVSIGIAVQQAFMGATLAGPKPYKGEENDK